MIDGLKIGVVVPSAGRGMRMGGKQKQLLEICGKPVLAYSLEAFEQSPLIDAITVVTNRESISKVEEIVRKKSLAKINHVIEGGEQRQDSVWNGLRMLEQEQIDVVLVHDAARPFVTDEIISRVITAAMQFKAAIVAVPSKDTIKIADDSAFVQDTPKRDNCWLIQTPQAFNYRLLYQAFQKAYSDNYYGTDEACIVERFGVRVKIVAGNYENIKITTPEDLEIAQLIAKKRVSG